jgi:hypothetical protein
MKETPDAYHQFQEPQRKRSQRHKVLRLAADVLERGFDLSTLPIVMPSSENKGRYTVLEGNRRLTAIRLLENPELSQGVLSAGRQRRLVEYSKQYKTKPITTVLAVEYPDRESADLWIERRHTGYQAGVGIIPWGSKEAARFNERGGRRSPALQVLNFVKDSGILDQTTLEELENFPLTNLDRVIRDPAARERLGLTKTGDGRAQVTARTFSGRISIKSDAGPTIRQVQSRRVGRFELAVDRAVDCQRIVSFMLSAGSVSINRLRGSIPARAGFVATKTLIRCAPALIRCMLR